MTASYLTDPSSIEVCGVTSLDSFLYCWRLRNGTSWWQKLDDHVEYRNYDDGVDDDYDEDGNDEHQPCSHRHEAATIIVEDEKYMFGGKR